MNVDIKKILKESIKSFLIEDELKKYLLDNNDDTLKFIRNIRYNELLIHFSTKKDKFNNDKNILDIKKNGFTKGTDNLEKLKKTSGYDEQQSGYNFAFLADNVSNNEAKYYCGYDSYDRVSSNAIAFIFNASGVLTYHNIDKQYQVIFKGETAKNIIPIYFGDLVELNHIKDGTHKYVDEYGDEYEDYLESNDFIDVFSSNRNSSPYHTWYIKGKNGRVLYANYDISKIVEWVKTNYNQYKHQLIYDTNAINDFR